MEPETWYVLEDGSAADPREVSPDKAGILRHKDGRAVAYAPHGPRSRSINPDEERAKPKGVKPKEPKATSEGRDMKAEESPRPYRTRESKAE